jgi:hypothetical protein
LTQNKDESKENPYLDTFHVAYKGMTLFTDEENKAFLTYTNGNKIPLVFSDWKEIDETSFELLFSENVSLHCKISGEKHDSLNISVNLPTKSKEISIPYKFSKSYRVTESNSKRMLLKSSNTQTALKAPEIKESELVLFASNRNISYADYVPVTRFTFDTILENPLAQVDFYMQTKKNIKNINEYITHMNRVSENITESENCTYNIDATLEELVSEMKEKTSSNTVDSIFETDNKEKSFATAKKVCLEMIASQKSTATDNDIYNKLNEMEAKLSKKNYNFDSYTKDMLYMTELQEVLK